MLFDLTGVVNVGCLVADCKNVAEGTVADGIENLIVLLELFFSCFFGSQQRHGLFITTAVFANLE